MTDTEWRSILNPVRLALWMDSAGLSSGPISSIELLAGGTQNLLVRFIRGHRAFVLRRPAAHPRPDADRTINREIRVLSALAGTAVPHPRLIAGCLDRDLMGTAFYLMEPVEGFNPTVTLPPLHATSSAVRHRMGLALVEALAQLASLDPAAIGLVDFGRVDGFLERQSARWQAQLEGYGKFTGWRGYEDLPQVDHIATWLERNRPALFEPSVIDGDFHFANVMYAWDSGELAAIVDWEMATIGPALLDLGWLLSVWPDRLDETDNPPLIEPWQGFPTSEEIVRHYHQESGIDVTELAWYRVLACYKFGIVLEGTNARAASGQADRHIGDRMHERAIRLLRKASRLTAEV